LAYIIEEEVLKYTNLKVQLRIEKWEKKGIRL
jgi:hypothetical protein